jgi:hypothetical protein
VRLKSVVLIAGLLAVSLVLIVGLRWLALSHVRNLAQPRLDPLQGRWEVTWDRGTEDEMSAEFALDRVTLRRFSFWVSDQGVVTFTDDEGCFHQGVMGEGGRLLSGQYSQCIRYPNWVGTWDAVRR